MALTIISQPNEFNHSRHPFIFRVESDSAGFTTLKARFELYKSTDDSLVFITANRPMDANKRAEFDFSAMLTDLVKPGAPLYSQTGTVNTSTALEYYIKMVEIVDDVETAPLQSANKFAIFGSNGFFLTEYKFIGIDDQKDFVALTAKPLERVFRMQQLEILSWLFPSAVAAPVLRVKINYSDATSHTETQAISAIEKGSIINFDLSDLVWDFEQHQPAKIINSIEIDFSALAGDKITLAMKANTRRSRDFVFANDRGGWDVLNATGSEAQDERINGRLYTNEDHVVVVEQDIRQDFFTQGSGYLPKNESSAYKQLRDINRAWRLVNSQLTGIAIVPGQTRVQTDGQNLNEFNFQYTAGDGRQNYEIINAIQF